MPRPPKREYTLTEATLALLLAARIHKSSAAVRRTAKQLLKRTNNQTRAVVALVHNARYPLAVLDQFLEKYL